MLKEAIYLVIGKGQILLSQHPLNQRFIVFHKLYDLLPIILWNVLCLSWFSLCLFLFRLHHISFINFSKKTIYGLLWRHLFKLWLLIVWGRINVILTSPFLNSKIRKSATFNLFDWAFIKIPQVKDSISSIEVQGVETKLR